MAPFSSTMWISTAGCVCVGAGEWREGRGSVGAPNPHIVQASTVLLPPLSFVNIQNRATRYHMPSMYNEVLSLTDKCPVCLNVTIKFKTIL